VLPWFSNCAITILVTVHLLPWSILWNSGTLHAEFLHVGSSSEDNRKLITTPWSKTARQQIISVTINNHVYIRIADIPRSMLLKKILVKWALFVC
jgi:hypothetical protein